MDLGSSVPSQLLAEQLLASWDDVRTIRRAQLTERHALTGRLLAEHLPSWGLHPWLGGLFVWIETDRDGDRLAQLARRDGVVVLPGSLLSASARHNRFIRVSLAPASPTLEEGLLRLIGAVARQTAHDRSQPDVSEPMI